MLACYRYIELNPVRAGMVRHPRDYRWSSFHANGDGRPDPLLSPHEEYLRLARTDSERLVAYRALFRPPMDPQLIDAIRQATNGNYVLGGKRFQREMGALLKRRVTRGVAGRPKAESATDDRQQALI